jgi:hypothetical protein
MKSTDLWRAILSRESRVMTFCAPHHRWTSVSVEPIDRERDGPRSLLGARVLT